MKIYDVIKENNIETFLAEFDNSLAKKGILLEAPQPAGAAPAGMSWNGSMWVPQATAAPAASPANTSPPPAASSRNVKRARIAAKKTSRAVSAKASSSAEAIKAKISKQLTLVDLKGNKVEKFIPKTAFKFLVAIKWLGMLPFFYEYWQQKVAIDMLLENGEMSEEDASAGQRIIVQELVAKIIVSASFANLLKWILRLRYLRFAAWAAGATASVATLGIFGGPAIITILATEAAAIALQQFLNSEKGKEIIAYCVMYAIDPTVTWIWDAGPGAWFEWLKSPQLSAQGKEQVTALSTAPGKAQEKATAASPTNIAAKPSANAQSDLDASSSSIFKAVPAYGSGGKDLGWATSNPYMGKGGGTAPPLERK
jgi:hypothetical protein